MYTSDKAVRFYDTGKRLVAKYGDLLEGIQDDYTKAVTAILLENETQWLESMDEATRITNVGSFDKYVYPLIRRVKVRHLSVMINKN